MTLHAILWDLDGTLADTEELHFQSWRNTLTRYGIDYTFDLFITSFGRTNAEILPELLGPASTPAHIETISLEKEANYRELLRQSALQALPGVHTWLSDFRQAGVQQAIGSSGPMANIVASIEALRIGDYFNSIISGARLPKGKPDPAIFLLAAAALGVQPEQCVVIEDSVAGIEAARRAGMRSVAVGKVIHSPRLHERLAAVAGQDCILVESLEALRWEHLEG
jgi:beta-phosphoglucomutase family hydrolase